MPNVGVGLVVATLVALSLAAAVMGVVYFQVTRAEAQRRQRIRQTVIENRALRHRPPLLSKGEVPENPRLLLRSQYPWWRRLLRR